MGEKKKNESRIRPQGKLEEEKCTREQTSYKRALSISRRLRRCVRELEIEHERARARQGYEGDKENQTKRQSN